MIEQFNVANRKEYGWLLEFLNENFDHDFYFTHQNSRIFVTDKKTLGIFLRECSHIYTIKEKGDYSGIIAVWKSLGGNKFRYYVKLNAKTPKIAKDLITVLLWNCSKDLYFKIRKNSRFLNAIKKKGFKFKGGRGIQILLHRKYRPDIFKINIKEEED